MFLGTMHAQLHARYVICSTCTLSRLLTASAGSFRPLYCVPVSHPPLSVVRLFSFCSRFVSSTVPLLSLVSFRRPSYCSILLLSLASFRGPSVIIEGLYDIVLLFSFCSRFVSSVDRQCFLHSSFMFVPAAFAFLCRFLTIARCSLIRFTGSVM